MFIIIVLVVRDLIGSRSIIYAQYVVNMGHYKIITEIKPWYVIQWCYYKLYRDLICYIHNFEMDI